MLFTAALFTLKTSVPHLTPPHFQPPNTKIFSATTVVEELITKVFEAQFYQTNRD